VCLALYVIVLYRAATDLVRVDALRDPLRARALVVREHAADHRDAVGLVVLGEARGAVQKLRLDLRVQNMTSVKSGV
jgi:hypothetical protein